LPTSRMPPGLECTLEPRTPFSPEEPPPRASARVRASYLASVAIVRRSLRSPDRRDARCVGPTSAFSRSSYEHSCLVGSRLSRDGCAPSATRGYRLLSRQSDSLRRATRSPLLGVLLPKCRTVSRTSDTSVATSVVRCHSRGQLTAENRQERLSFHPREQADDPMRSEMPSVVQGPLPCSTLSNARLRTSSGSRLGRRKPVSRRLFREQRPLRVIEC